MSLSKCKLRKLYEPHTLYKPHKHVSRQLVLAALTSAVLCTARAEAQEVSVYGGIGRLDRASESTYSWGFTYLQALDEHNALSYSWLNEGHYTDHHRDGFALQYWRRAWLFDHRLALAGGVGAYDYFDTTASDEGRPYADVHGWALIYSLSATWYTSSPWFYQVRINRTDALHSIHTTTAMLGIGYQLGASGESGNGGASGSTGPSGEAGWLAGSGNEIAVLAGRTEVNSLRSPGAFAKSVEFRHGFTPYIEASVTWLDEGETQLTRRNGVATQVWLGRSFLDDKLRLGLGAGPYVAVDTYREPGGTNTGDKVSALVTMTASYQFTPHWFVRASWDRVLTGYDKDSDIYLGGIGYRF
jgi:hypothetical protein